MKQIINCYSIPVEKIDKIVDLAKSEDIDLVIVGPEVPLCLGIVDALQEVSIPAFGLKRWRHNLNLVKKFCKSFFKRHNIPTAEYKSFNQLEPALNYIDKANVPIVIKASGLAAGKGVIIASSKEDARIAVKSMLVNKMFGESGSNIVIEEYLEGEEVSIHVLVSNNSYSCLSSSQDHKRIGENATGLNTGGMGAYAPTSMINDVLYNQIDEKIIKPTIEGLNKDGIKYNGVLYAGLVARQQT